VRTNDKITNLSEYFLPAVTEDKVQSKIEIADTDPLRKSLMISLRES
jgi:hypothetical protein